MSENKIEIVTPQGAFGSYAGEEVVTTAMRIIGVGFGSDDEWASKYGTDYENDVFLMKPYCWCDKEDGTCLWCIHGDHPQFDELLRARFGTTDYQEYRDRRYYDPPNFWFKPTDFRLNWYKYIGRDMASNKEEIAGDFLAQVFATHPKGMTVDDAIEKTARLEEESARSFRDMFESFGKFTGPA